MGRSLLWKLLATNLLVVVVAVTVAAMTIGSLADATFSGLMKQFHIDVDPLHRLFTVALTRSLVIASLAGGGVALLLSVLVFRLLVRPLQGMERMAGRIAAGDYAGRAEAASRDEVGRLAESLNTMAGALESMERLRKDLVANVAHELRTPLANLRGYLEALRDGVAPPSKELIGSLHEEVMRLVRLVDALHELSLFDARAAHARRGRVDLSALIAAVVELRRPEFSARGIVVRNGVLPGIVVSGDADLLKQAVHNLLDNAGKYTRPGGEVEVRIRTDDRGTAIEVNNTGEEIAAADLPFIFERFYRAEKSRSRDLGGAGIGLSIVKEVARVHGGEVGARSQDGRTSVWLTVGSAL